MCLNPRHIKLNSNGLSSQIRPSNLFINNLYSQPLEVPCRNCIECTLQRQKDYTQFLTEVMKKRGNIAFRTLTYRQEMLPLAASTAENESPYDFKLLNVCVRNKGLIVKSFHKNRPHKQEYCVGPNNDAVFLTPSLHRADVAQVMKLSRQEYVRKFSCNSEHKYFYVGEYGSKTSRPHYHIVFFGVSKEFLQIFETKWQELFGFTYSSKEQMRTDGFVKGDTWAVASYVAKYVTKGVFEIPYINAVEKPRVISSCGLLRFTEDEIAYFRGFDWLKEHNLFGNDCTSWTYQEQIDYYELLKNRLCFKSHNENGDIETFPFSTHLMRLIWLDSFKLNRPIQVNCYCPDFIKNKIFIGTKYEEKISFVYFKNELFYLYSYFTRVRNMDAYALQCPQVENKPFNEMSCEEQIIVENYRLDKAQDNKAFNEKSLFEFYRNSVY